MLVSSGDPVRGEHKKRLEIVKSVGIRKTEKLDKIVKIGGRAMLVPFLAEATLAAGGVCRWVPSGHTLRNRK